VLCYPLSSILYRRLEGCRDLEWVGGDTASGVEFDRAQVAASRQRIAAVGYARDDREIVPIGAVGLQRRKGDPQVEGPHALDVDQVAEDGI
jgi:hypothetical protein